LYKISFIPNEPLPQLI